MNERSAIKNFDLETYQTLVAYNGDILFEWDLESDRFYATPNLFDTFGYMPPSENFTSTLENSPNIYPDDRSVIKDYLETIQFIPHDLKSGKYYAKLEIRIRNIYQKYIWCQLRLIARYSERNMPYKISGMITNIDFDKKHHETLLTQAQKDLLTGLYNKATATKLMQEWLSAAPGDKTGALVLIDIDGFKDINDHFGHLFGDAVLADVAATIRDNFVGSDIVGRIGGDEFAVCIKEIYSLAVLKKNLKRLNLRLIHTYQSGDKTYGISASIGIALFPAHGREFKTLFQNADQALYYVKKHSKNDFLLYRERLPQPAEKKELAAEIKIPRAKPFDENICEYIFKILYNTDDSKAAVQVLLEILGKRLKVGRAFLYRRSADQTAYEKSSEWCDVGVPRLHEAFDRLPADKLDAYWTGRSHGGYLVCSDSQALPPQALELFGHEKTRAFLHVRIAASDAVYGWIGFDECRARREWGDYEINIATFLADVLTAFIQRRRTLLRLGQSQSNLAHLLQKLSVAAYVASCQTHEVLFANEQMQRFLDGAPWENRKCHEMMRGAAEPCARCPLREAAAKDRAASFEAYDEIRGVQLKKTFLFTHWDNDTDCFLVQLEPAAPPQA